MENPTIIDQFTAEDMILNAEDKRTKALIATLWHTGHRVSEVINIRKNDVWFDDTWIWFRLSVGKRRREFTHTIKMPIKAMFVKYILQYLPEVEDGEKLFDISRQYVGILLRRLNKDVNPHMFRHSLATRLAEKGASKWELDAWFGWSDTGNTSGIYVSKGTALIENIAAKIE